MKKFEIKSGVMLETIDPLIFYESIIDQTGIRIKEGTKFIILKDFKENPYFFKISDMMVYDLSLNRILFIGTGVETRKYFWSFFKEVLKK